VAALDRRAANLRTESIPTLTTGLARRHGTIVIEDLDLNAMAHGMGRRGFRRGVYQGWAWYGPTDLGVQVRLGGWAAAGRRPLVRVLQDPPGCGVYLADLPLGAREWVCPTCGELVDRNANAARTSGTTSSSSRNGCPSRVWDPMATSGSTTADLPTL